MSEFNGWEEVADVIEHTAVGPSVLTRDAVTLANEVNVYGFRAAVVTPHHVQTVADILHDDRALVSVIGYPYGIDPTRAKLAEIESVADIVDELDLVMNRIAFFDDDLDRVRDDIQRVRSVFPDGTLKVIIETPVLSPYQIEIAATLVVEGGADIVKTAVGYDGAASVRHVEILRDILDDDVGIKASGGIRTYGDLCAMVDAGADRIGTSSGVEIHSSAKPHLS